MIEAREFHAGLHCLQVAIERLKQQDSGGSRVSLRLRLAEVFSQVGHSGLAAEETKRLLAEVDDADSLGKSSMLRLRYLL